MEHRFQPGDRVRVAEDAYRFSRANGLSGVVLSHRGRMTFRGEEDLLVLVDLGLRQNVVVGERNLSLVESLEDRQERLKPFTESSRFALTEDDVRHDYVTGKHRYAE